VPIYYNHYRTGRPITNTPEDAENKYQSKYIDELNSPLYPFGFGLSYAEIMIDSVKLAATTIATTDQLQVKVTLTNHSAVAGKTVIETYAHQNVAETVRPVESLIDFEKVSLNGNESKTFTLTIPCSRLANIHLDLSKQVDAGQYSLLVGLDSANLITVPFTLE
jgi:hypothetical protein